MKLIMTTPLLVFKSDAFAAQIDRFDPTFSQRYLDSYEMEGFGNFYTLQGEKHWEADKYNILFLECADDKISQLLADMKECGQCELIAPVDEKYEVNGQALYADQELLILLKKQGRDIISRNIAFREVDFAPRISPNN